MRLRIVQTLAVVALLHSLAPVVDPAHVRPGALEQHYGETVQLEGRVTDVEPNGEVLRLTLTRGGEHATVLTRDSSVPLGASVSLRGQPTPGEQGPVVWAEGPVQTLDEGESGEPVPLAEVLVQAPRWRQEAIAVAGTWTEDGPALVAETGRLSAQPVGVDPEPGPVVVWGRLVYEPAQAGYELEATGWRPWTPPPR